MKSFLTKKHDLVVILQNDEIRALKTATKQTPIEATLYFPETIGNEGVIKLYCDNHPDGINQGLGVEQRHGIWSVAVTNDAYLQLRSDGRIERIQSALGRGHVCIYNESKLGILEKILDYAFIHPQVKHS